MDNPLAILITLVIAGAWAAYLLPSIFVSRRNAPLQSTQEFNRITARLASVHGHAVESADLARRRVLSRRRKFLAGLALAGATTLAIAIWQGSSILLIAHIVIDAIGAWYVAMLLQIKQRRVAPRIVDLRPVEESPEERHLRIVSSSSSS
ncbi:MAG: hypothetical protein OEM81_01755 [Acidimicrobiia bacterium]|nr:hypothetical protein [Acidimicrobiia bacterium]MDH3396535.1 hypothetical protein [Acidimicrobiia bacterium]